MSEPLAIEAGKHHTFRSDLGIVGELFRATWAPFLVCAGIVMAAAIAFIVLAPSHYEADAVILIQPQSDFVDEKTAPTATTELVRSQLDVVQSRPVLEAVVRKLSLVEDPEFKPKLPQIRRADPVAATAERLGKHISAANDGRSYVIRLMVRSRDPRKAARIANAIADQYIQVERAQKSQTMSMLTRGLETKADELRQRARRADAAAEAFREKANLVMLADAPDTVAADNGFTASAREALEAARQKAELDAFSAQAQARLSVQQQQVKSGRGAGTTEVTASPVIGQLRAQETELARSEANLLTRYKPDHPLVAPVHAQLAAVRGAIEAETSRIHNAVAAQSDSARRSERFLAGVVTSLNRSVNGEITAATRYRQLKAEARIQNKVFEDFATQATRAAERIDVQLPDALLVSPASPPLSPTQPQKPVVAFAAVIVALIAGIAGSAAVALLRPRLLGPNDASRVTGLPVVWTACSLGARHTEQVELSRTDRAVLARLTALALAAAHGRKPVMICVVSPGPQPRSFAAEWADELGFAGASVLLVSDHLAPACRHRPDRASSVVVRSGAELCAAIHRDPSFDAFRRDAEADFTTSDFIIVDADPDTVLLPALAASFEIHLALLLVSKVDTNKDAARAATRRLQAISIEPSGVVLA